MAAGIVIAERELLLHLHAELLLHLHAPSFFFIIFLLIQSPPRS
jgi:hypothetical protein